MRLDRRSSAAKQREAVAQDRVRAAIERSMLPKLRGEMTRFIREYSAKISQGSAIELVVLQHKMRLESLLTRVYAASISQTAKRMEQQKTAGITWDKKAESYVDTIIKEWILGHALEKSTLISGNSMTIARRLLVEATSEGLDEKATARKLRSQFTKLGAHRARTIARTETHAASQDASMKVARELSPTTALIKEWIAVEDGRTRESHRSLHERKVAMDERFNAGGSALLHPGDPSGSAAEIVNCRCVLVYEEQ